MNMHQTISPKLTALVFGVLVISFLAVFYAIAWQEPGALPPEGNVAMPLNTGNVGQAKQGGLILNTNGTPESLGLVVDKGKICLGTVCLEAWPSGGGGSITTYRETVSAFNVGIWKGARSVSFTCPDGGTPSITYCKNVSLTPGNGCVCSGSTLTALVAEGVACPSPRTWSLTSACQEYNDGICNAMCQMALNCEMEFTCGKKETVGNPAAQECQFVQKLWEGGNGPCDSVVDNNYCNGQCASVGWASGSAVSCTPTTIWTAGTVFTYQCGLNYQTWADGETTGYKKVTCKCSM